MTTSKPALRRSLLRARIGGAGARHTRAGAVAFAAATAWACQSGDATSNAGPAPEAAAAVAVAPATAAGAPAVAAGSGDDVLVRVNGQPVTRAQVDKRIDTFVGPQLAMVPPEQRDQVKQQLLGKVLDEMVVQELLTQAADKQQIPVSDEEVESSVREITASLPDGKTVADYLQVLGLDEPGFKRELAHEIKIEKLIDREVTAATPPTDQEVARFYAENIDKFQVPERVHVRHVLVAAVPGEDADARAAKRAKAEAAREQLAANKGERFAEIAAEVSDCPSKERGGDLGEFGRGEMVESFEKAAFAQPVGEIGPVVETEFGYHVIQVQERAPARTVELAEAKTAIALELTGTQRRAAIGGFIDGLRAEATIAYPDEKAA
jgi:peptidyl-prolyl cis-trans isomerase C